jgi:hypothetical protein
MARERGTSGDARKTKNQPATAVPYMFSMMADAKADVPTFVAPGIMRSRS